MVRTIRIISQSFFFVLFTVMLFAFNRNPWVHNFPTEQFLQINPLLFVLTSLASRAVIYALLPGALIITILSIFTGRTFCGFICPLGAAIDFSDRFITKKARNSSSRPRTALQKLKYILLFIFTILAVLGILVPCFVDPISITTRIMTSIVEPAIRSLTSSISHLLIQASNIFTENKKELPVFEIAVSGVLPALLLFVVIFAAGIIDRRFWCQYICPTGAFLGLLGKFSFFRRSVNSHNCNNCRACSSRQCPTRAIGHEEVKQTNTTECILCGLCAENNRGCTTIGFSKPVKAEIVPVNISRRTALGSIATGVLLPSVIKGTALSSTTVQPVRPPGSLPEQQFLSRCLGCGECIKACPNHALQPSGFTDGLILLNTPRLTPSIGYCEPDCTACTKVCPTVAIRPVPTEEKPYIKMGTAIVYKDHCLAWRGDMHCMVCMQHCPYQAITEQEITIGEESFSGPLVNKDLCTGCGACETNCVNKSYRSIRVFNYGERRVASGAFITEKKKQRIESQRRELQQEEE